MKNFDFSRINPNLIIILVTVVVAFILVKMLTGRGFGKLFLPDDELKKQEKNVSNISVDKSEILRPETELKKRADLSLQAMDDVGTNEKMLFQQVEGLNAEELKLVYKYFGVQSERVFGLPIFTGDLINWYYNELSGKDLIKMREIWKKTGLMP